MSFLELVKKKAAEFKTGLPKRIRIVSHYDADGISAAAILAKGFLQLNIPYTITIVPQLTTEIIKGMDNVPEPCILFSDMGSTLLEEMTCLSEKQVVVLDHHHPKGDNDTIMHINPHLSGLDGGKVLSASGVCYLFMNELTDIRSMAPYALVGALGDCQDAFSELHAHILKDCTLEIKKGITLLGYQERNLVNVLNGTVKDSRAFLEELQLSPEQGLQTLTDVEMVTLAEGLAARLQRTPEQILRTHYLLPHEDEPLLKELHAITTVLNACGRKGKSSLGIGICLGDEESRKQGLVLLAEYLKQVMEAISWVETNKDFVRQGSHFLVFNAQDHIEASIVGIVASKLQDKIAGYVLGMARAENAVKVSIRSKHGDARILLLEILDQLGKGSGGGHAPAAGGAIPLASEEEFYNLACTVLQKKSVEEGIIR